MHRLTTYTSRLMGLLFAFILACYTSGAHAQGAVTPDPSDPTPSLRMRVEASILDRAVRDPAGLSYAIATIRVAEPWAAIDLYPLRTASGPAIATGGRVLLAYHAGGTWQLIWPDDPGYAHQLAEVPDSLVDPLAKQILLDSRTSAARAAGMDVVGGYRLPWPGGEGAYVTQNYADHGLGQIDFWIPSAAIVAAKAGEVVYADDSHWLHGCSTQYARYNNMLVVRHSPTEYTLYLHIAKDSVPASIKNLMATQGFAPVAQSDPLATQGNVGYTCGGDGSHLHLSSVTGYFVYTNADDLDEDGDGDRNELMPSAWGSGHQPVDFAEATYDRLAGWPYDTTIISQNNRAICTDSPATGVTLFADFGCQGDRQDLSGETPLTNLPAIGWNDRIRSLLVAPGWSLRVYRHANGLGASRCLATSQSNLGGTNFDGSTLPMDRAISSLQVFHGDNCQPAPVSVLGVTLPPSLTLFSGGSYVVTTTFSVAGSVDVRLTERQRAWRATGADVPERPDRTTTATDLAAIDVWVPAGAQIDWFETMLLETDDIGQSWVTGKTTMTLQSQFRGQDAMARPISVTIDTPIVLDSCGDPAEWNDMPAQATSLAIDDSYRGVICPTGDVDFYTFAAVAGQPLTVTLEAAADGSPLDPQVTVLAPNGETVVATADDTGSTVDTLLPFTPSVTGDYIVQVAPVGAGSAGPAYTYTVSVRDDDRGLRACQPSDDAFEPDDDAAAAVWLATDGQSTQHTLPQATDVDWVQFEAIAGVRYTVTASSKTQVPTLVVLAPDATTELTQADTLGSPVTQITWQPSQSGRHFLRLSPATPAQAGCQARYALAVAADDVTPPSVTLQINDGAALANTRAVSITVIMTDTGAGVDAIQMANLTNFAGTPWQPPTAIMTWTLAVGDGAKTIYGRVRDRAGNLSAIAGAAITLDTTAPAGQLSTTTNGATVIGDQAAFTIDASSDANAMRLRVGDALWSDWLPLATQTTLPMPGTTGPLQVELAVRDRAGNISAVSSLLIDHYETALFLPAVGR